MFVYISLGIGVTLFVVIVYAWILHHKYKAGKTDWKKYVEHKLEHISKDSYRPDKRHVYHALIEAYKLLDVVLQKMGVQGKGMYQRINNSKNLVGKETLDKLIEAHKAKKNLERESVQSYPLEKIRVYNTYITSGIRELIV